MVLCKVVVVVVVMEELIKLHPCGNLSDDLWISSTYVLLTVLLGQTGAGWGNLDREFIESFTTDDNCILQDWSFIHM